MRRKTAVIVVLLSVLAAGVACRRGSGEGTPPTLPPPGPKTETLRFRLVSAQTGRPVAGARVVVRRGDRAGAGDVLAEAVSDGDGWVTVTYTVRDAGDRPHLEIDAGERFLPRAVWVDDTAAEPAPDVRTLWELRPEIGADRCVTLTLNYGPDGCDSRRPGSIPRGDFYVMLQPEIQAYRPYFEEAARRVEAAFPRWRWRFVDWVSPEETRGAPPSHVPPDGVALWVRLMTGSCVGGAGSSPGSNRTADVFICDGSLRNVGTIAHEFGHVLGLQHLPPGVCGVMSGYYCGADDFTELERWAAAPRMRRAPPPVAGEPITTLITPPDDTLRQTLAGSGLTFTCIQGGRP